MSKLAHSHQPTMDLIEAQARADVEAAVRDEPPEEKVAPAKAEREVAS